MIEHAVRVAGVARQQLGGGLFGGRISLERGSPVAGQVAYLAHQHQGAGAAAERVPVEPIQALALVVRERPLADRIQHVQPANRLQLLAQIGEHVFDQALGLGPLALGLALALDSGQHEKVHHDDQPQRGAGDAHQPALPPSSLALDQRIQRQPGQAGDQLQLGHPPAVGARADVGGDGLRHLVGNAALAIHMKAQRRWKKTSDVAFARIAGRNQRQHPGFAVHALEEADFLVDPMRGSGVGRANDDQEIRIRQRLAQRVGQVAGRRKLVTVAKNGCQPDRHRTDSGLFPDQPGRQPIALQRAMQPLGHRLVGMAVTDERPIAPLVGHSLPPRRPDPPDPCRCPEGSIRRANSLSHFSITFRAQRFPLMLASQYVWSWSGLTSCRCAYPTAASSSPCWAWWRPVTARALPRPLKLPARRYRHAPPRRLRPKAARREPGA